MIDETAGKTISAADFVAAFRRYIEEVGLPATARQQLPRSHFVGANEQPRSIKGPGEPAAQPTAPTKRAHEEKREAEKRQGTLW